jgi:tagatose 1,6-diphosphate aldolase
MSISAGKYWGMRRMADRGGRFKMVAVDQRPPIKNLIKERRGTAEAPWDDVARFKELLITSLQDDASALLLDPHYALPRGLALLDAAKGLVVTLEDSIFTETAEGRLSGEIDHWSVEKIKRLGGDAVKVLAWYRPDAGRSVCRAQQDFVARIGAACAKYDVPFVFELLVYPLARDAEQTKEYVEMKAKRPDMVLESVRVFADPRFGVDLFKLESPLAADDVPGVDAPGGDAAQRWFDDLGSLAGRPWVMLSAGAGMAAFRNVLAHAYRAGASGYLAGRAIWMSAFQKFPDWAAIASDLARDGRAYMAGLNALTDAHARPWHNHPCYGAGGAAIAPPDAGFRRHYPGFGD